jgi:IclR family pca regulon transcriptional regulator
VRTLDRGLALIRAFGASRPTLTLSEAALAAGISRAAARRLLLTLQRLGYVRSDDGWRFALRPAVLDLGHASLASLPWWREAQRLVGPLAVAPGHPCTVGVLDGAEVGYVAYAAPAPAPAPVLGMDRSIGTRLPAYATAIGRVLMAGLPDAEADARLAAAPPAWLRPCTETDPARLRAILAEVRQDRACLLDQEPRLGLRSLGVPVEGRAGLVRAALGVSFGVTEPADPRIMLGPLSDTAARIDLHL